MRLVEVVYLVISDEGEVKKGWQNDGVMWMRFSRVARPSDCQCQSRNSPEAEFMYVQFR
jgi:hypothetical protein